MKDALLWYYVPNYYYYSIYTSKWKEVFYSRMIQLNSRGENVNG